MSAKYCIVKNWNDYLECFNDEKRDIYFCEEYIKLYETPVDTAECFIYEENNNIFLFPYLKREIKTHNTICYDFTNGYGYGGPIANSNDRSFINNAYNRFHLTMQKNKFIAGFVRFSPILNNWEYVNDRCEISYDRNTIAVDLTLTKEDIWENHIHSKHRNVIRKAEQLGLSYIVDNELTYLDAFREIYQETMLKVNADSFYMFDNKYYLKAKESLAGKLFLGLVLKSDIVIASAMFFVNPPYGHYHLAGSKLDYLSFYPNNFLVYHTILYMKSLGLKLLHLGGGNDVSESDTLYKFKKRFSQLQLRCYIGKLIFNKEKYDEICKSWSRAYPNKFEKFKNFHLKYRY